MMKQLEVIRRIKDLREEQASRRVRSKRLEVTEALARLMAARQAVHDSERTLPAREAAIFKPVLKHVVSCDDLELAKAKLEVLQKEHSRLIDSAERAAHVHRRLQKQLDEAIEEHRKAMAEQDKYALLSEEITAEYRAEISYREEVEVEDLLIGRAGGGNV